MNFWKGWLLLTIEGFKMLCVQCTGLVCSGKVFCNNNNSCLPIKGWEKLACASLTFHTRAPPDSIYSVGSILKQSPFFDNICCVHYRESIILAKCAWQLLDVHYVHGILDPGSCTLWRSCCCCCLYIFAVCIKCSIIIILTREVHLHKLRAQNIKSR